MGRKKLAITEEEVVNYIINNKTSIRETAEHFGCKKDIIFDRIHIYNGIYKEKIQEILQENIKKSRF